MNDIECCYISSAEIGVFKSYFKYCRSNGTATWTWSAYVYIKAYRLIIAEFHSSLHSTRREEWTCVWLELLCQCYIWGKSFHNVSCQGYRCALQWRHSERDGVLNHRRLDCLLNCLFGCRSKKTRKLCVTVIGEGNPPVTGGFPHKGPVTWKLFPFDDVIMNQYHSVLVHWHWVIAPVPAKQPWRIQVNKSHGIDF